MNKKVKLSCFDKKYLSNDDKELMLHLKRWFSLGSEYSESYHNAAETIRARYGYSGGVDGEGYRKLSCSRAFRLQKKTTKPTFDETMDLINEALWETKVAQEKINILLKELKSMKEENK